MLEANNLDWLEMDLGGVFWEESWEGKNYWLKTFLNVYFW